MPNAFSVHFIFTFTTQGCRCAPTAGLKLANAFGVLSRFQRGTTRQQE